MRPIPSDKSTPQNMTAPKLILRRTFKPPAPPPPKPSVSNTVRANVPNVAVAAQRGARDPRDYQQNWDGQRLDNEGLHEYVARIAPGYVLVTRGEYNSLLDDAQTVRNRAGNRYNPETLAPLPRWDGGTHRMLGPNDVPLILGPVHGQIRRMLPQDRLPVLRVDEPVEARDISVIGDNVRLNHLTRRFSVYAIRTIRTPTQETIDYYVPDGTDHEAGVRGFRDWYYYRDSTPLDDRHEPFR